MTKKGTITVKGKGFASAPPDTIEVAIELSATKDTYEEAMNDSSNRLEGIRTALRPHHFNKEDLKTAHFHIDTEYDYPENKDGVQQRRLVGYRYIHKLYFEFQNDSEFLGEVLESLSKSEMNPDFSVRFKLKDQTKIKKIMLEEAVHDARDKALILTKASGVKLDRIESIQYDWSEIELYSSNFLQDTQMMRASSSVMDIQPEDIENSETVSITWNLANE
ncbi:SIMPL domain-containing protein [Jeotgalibaca sp. MA1X17-3]|uniref:SIMPL domain-containing protein n=1 Tax=Jeotgalibaca sp. MA1X17-3 TaxID=2908211 RepID=UPI001F43705E|nr:SIMPL domain-containing protein [Jeotgalibaca sp. MA1X17-3]UJF15435.1 SIMPL domain-containing protein [Jeotgalibaca sp. MA1X17-3]